MKFFYVFNFLFLAVVVSNSYAGSYTTAPFDKNVNVLEPNYVGYDPKLMYEQLDKKLKKDEFETTEEHNKRLKKGISILSDMRIDEKEFVVSDNISMIHPPVYDADSKTLNIDPSFSKCIESDSPITLKNGCYSLTVSIKELDSDYYIRHAVKFNNIQDFSGLEMDDAGDDAGKGKVKIKIKMDASTARFAKDKLRILIVFRITEPYTSEVFSLNSLKTSNRYIHSKISEIWVYNTETGQIYAKIKSDKAS